MSSVAMKSISGSDTGTVDLPDAVFGVQPNVPVMHQVVTAQLAKRRAGTQSTKTRAEVSGGGRKPFKQKGTGNARQGSTRAPHWAGGGVALGPKPRKYDQKTPKKMIRLALHSALSDRAAEGKVIVVDSWSFETPKTKNAIATLRLLGISSKALVVVDRDDENAILGFRNLPEVQLILSEELNAYDVLCNEWVVFSRQTLPSADSAKSKHAPVASESIVTTAAPASPAPLTAAAPHGDGSHAPLDDDSEPEGFPIKGNADSMLFHTPGSRFYNQTKAEVWFATEEAAEAAGFSKPASQKAEPDAPTATEETE